MYSISNTSAAMFLSIVQSHLWAALNWTQTVEAGDHMIRGMLVRQKMLPDIRFFLKIKKCKAGFDRRIWGEVFIKVSLCNWPLHYDRGQRHSLASSPVWSVSQADGDRWRSPSRLLSNLMIYLQSRWCDSVGPESTLAYAKITPQHTGRVFTNLGPWFLNESLHSWLVKS